MSLMRAKTKNVLNLDDSDGEDNSFNINTNYAERYDQWRGKEELQKLKDRYGDVGQNDAVESSSESSEEEEWTEEQEKDFLKTFSLLKKHDPKIYDGKTFFFNHEGPSEDQPGPSTKPTTKKPEKLTVRDHERKMILERGTLESDDEELPEEKDNDPTYVQDQANIKKGFQDALKSIESDDEGDDYLKSSLLAKRTKKDEEKQQEEEDYRKWLKGEVETLKSKDKSVQDMAYLKDYWNDSNLDEAEVFLRDYILNRKYMDPDNKKVPSYNEVVEDAEEEVNLQNDEAELEQMEQFEHKYNFRFEEPDQEFIKRYPRTIAASMRRADDKRKKQREDRKARKEAEKQKKRDEIQRLKALKKQEIMYKIKQVQENVGDVELDLEEGDVEGDFDPEEHDQRMHRLFNEKFYDMDEDEKPVFPYDEEIDGDLEIEGVKPFVPSDDDSEEGVVGDDKPAKKSKKKASAEADVAVKDEKNAKTQSLMDELLESTKGRRRGKKKSVFLTALERSKPAFDPKLHGSFEKYFEEYYNLHYEDLIGDLPCRFKYRNVPANDFGLSVDEILNAPDAELNQWVSVKKTFQYRSPEEEQQDIHTYKNKAKNITYKQKVLPSLFKPPEDEESEVNSGNQPAENGINSDPVEPSKKKKKKKKKKKSNSLPAVVDGADVKPDTNGIEDDEEEVVAPEIDLGDAKPDIESAKKKKKKKKKKKSQDEATADTIAATPVAPEPAATGVHPDSTPKEGKKRKQKEDNAQAAVGQPDKKKKKKEPELSDDRLLAYGLNPNKFRKQQKYGKKKDA